MTTDPYGQWMGTPMDDDDIDDLLGAAGWGILSLADGDEPYSIPISFGYDGEEIYFALIRADPPNRKFEFITDGATARLLVTDIRAKYDWRSVAVTGSVRAIERTDDLGGEGLLPEVDRKPDQTTERSDGWGVLLDILEENPWFSSEYERAEPVAALQGWRLEADDIRGVEVNAEGE